MTRPGDRSLHESGLGFAVDFTWRLIKVAVTKRIPHVENPSKSRIHLKLHRARNTLQRMLMPEAQRFSCLHIQRSNVHPTTVVRHTSLNTIGTRIGDLDTETQLCPICSGLLVSMLQLLETHPERVVAAISTPHPADFE